MHGGVSCACSQARVLSVSALSSFLLPCALPSALVPPGKLLLVIQLQIYTAPDALPSQASFSTNPSKPVGLDLVDAADQIQHELNLDDEFDLQEALDYFTFDPEYEANDKRFREVKREILGDSEEESQEADDDDEDMDPGAGDKTTVQDLTQQDLVNLRRTIYLTIMSSIDLTSPDRAPSSVYPAHLFASS